MLLFVALYTLALAGAILIVAASFLPLLLAVNRSQVANGKKRTLLSRYLRRTRRPLGDATLSDLKKVRKLGARKVSVICGLLLFLYLLPVFIVRIGLSLRYGTRWTWRLPVSLYEVWGGVLLVLCFVEITYGLLLFPTLLAFLIIIMSLYQFVHLFAETPSGLRIMVTPEHKLTFYETLSTYLIIICGFGCLFYGFSTRDPMAFSSQLGALDSIYYSFMIGTTVGFADIHPVSALAKLVTILEAFLGFIFIIFVVAIFLDVWINVKRRRTQQNGKEE